MFEDLFDELSKLWSWRWPMVEGKVVTVEIERLHEETSSEVARLCVVYSFCVGDDGPYGGEGFWKPPFTLTAAKRLNRARQKLRAGNAVLVRYRPDDPSINRLDRRVWRDI
jgi:hypothetical protein